MLDKRENNTITILWESHTWDTVELLSAMGKTRKKEGIPKGAGRMVTGLETVEKKKKKRVYHL